MAGKPLAASALGLSQVGPGGISYGVIDGFLAQMRIAPPTTTKSQSIEVLFRHQGEGKEEELRRALLESPATEASGIKPKHVAVDATTLRLSVPQGLTSFPAEAIVVERVRAVVGALQSVSSPGSQTCRGCGSTSGSEPLVLNGTVDRMCASCIERADDEIRTAAAEYESRSANLPLGLVFALAAGVVGAALYGGVMIATSRMLWILAIASGALVGFAALKGAGKGGPVVQGMAALVTVLSVLGGLLGFIAWSVHESAATKGHTIDWGLFLMKSPEILVDAGQDTVFSLAGGLVGAWTAIKRAQKATFATLRSQEKPSAGGNLSPG